jgi:hypothetical protein
MKYMGRYYGYCRDCGRERGANTREYIFLAANMGLVEDVAHVIAGFLVWLV